MTVITRFAPSPTGFLHIGGARTALFNYLFARHHGGKFLVRIEDTDAKRSTKEAIDAILDGLSWLGMEPDNDYVYQSECRDRHVEVAQMLLDKGKAYHCYCTPEELTEMREKARQEKKPFRYDGRWRDRDASEAPEGIEPVIRLKTETDGVSVINDLVQGEVKVPNSDLDDLVLVRSDGTPTYMLAVIVDDHDMNVTHVIRGDDHLTNAFRQKAIYEALEWYLPQFAHIPLIHGPDGAKLSKRHGALGVDAYRDMGYLPEAIRNYLLRLGWGHGDDEMISDEQAVEWFDLDGVGKSAARFDFKKLENLNGHYIREADNDRLLKLIEPFIEKIIARDLILGEDHIDRLQKGMDGLKERAKTIHELAESSVFYIERPPFTEQAAQILDDGGRKLIEANLFPILENIEGWDKATIETMLRTFSTEADVKFKDIAQPLRCALCGSTFSPGIFDVMEILGKDESLARLKDIG